MLKNSKGNIIVTVLALSFVAALVVSYLSIQTLNYTKSLQRGQSNLRQEIVLNSILDYTVKGVEQNWCFNQSWLRDEQCDLNHKMNTQRLLLSSKSIEALKETSAKKKTSLPTPISLSSIEHKISLSTITPRHPLFPTLKYLTAQDVTQIHVSIRKVEKDTIFSKGRESYLKITVALMTSKAFSEDQTTLESLIMVFPREISSFALVIPNNLYLGLSRVQNYGNASFPSSNSRGKGLTFSSPVFVNGSIIINNDRNSYTPVTFASDVILGSGSLKLGKEGFKPKTAGGVGDQLYSDIKSFGGFKNGIILSGKRDIGLDYLSGKKTGSSPGEKMKLCIKRNLASSDLSYTKKSSLIVKKTSSNSSAGRHSFRVGFDHWNRFMPQKEFISSVKSKNGQFREDPKIQNKEKTQKIIGRLKVKIGDKHTISADFSSGDKITFKPQFKQPGASLGTIKSSIQKTKDDLEKKEKKITEIEESLKNDTLTSEQKANLRAEKKSNQSDVKTLSQQKKDKEKKLNQAQAFLLEEGAPPLLTVNIADVFMDRFSQFNQKNVDIGFENQNTFAVDNIDVALKFYDIGVQKKKDVRTLEGFPKVDREYSFKFHRDTGSKKDFKLNDELSSEWKTPSGKIVKGLDSNFNYGELDTICDDPSSGVSFESTSWSYSFAPKTRHSWAFADPFDGLWSITRLEAGSTPEFKIRSIVKECVVESDATFVAGFIVCDKFVIKSRKSPLKIIGTIIAGQLEIAKSAMDAGIKWSSIYNPNAVRDLQRVGILSPIGGGNCQSIRSPIWHPRPSIRDLASHYKCSPISLREKANPFTWTSVDPDCGLLKTTSSRTTCKFQPQNFFIKEIGRELK